ncbi:unnamed protein product, partial [Didymodactylos carnosus]
ICKYHLNAFLQNCVETNRFTLPQFCKGFNEFPYSGSERLSKPSMNITIEDLKNWASVTKRLPAWECVKDHNDDGTLACNLFKHDTIFSQSQPLSDDLRLNIDQWKLPDLPTHVASSIQFIQFCIQSEQLFVYLTTI